MTRAVLDRGKLANILGMMGSDALGERASAAAMASRMVRDAGLTWSDILQPAPTSRPASQPKPQHSHRSGDGQVDARYAALLTCQRFQAHQTAWEQSFLVGISRRRFLSEKQLETLLRIAAELPGRSDG